MTKEDYLMAKHVIDHNENYPAYQTSFAHKQIEKWEFANQRVIEELERISLGITDTGESMLDLVVHALNQRIKELKQEYK